MFYLVEILRTSNPRGSISSNPEGNAPRRQGEEPGYTEFLQQRAGNRNIKTLLRIKGNQSNAQNSPSQTSTYVNQECPDVRAEFRKGRGKLLTSIGSS